VLRLEKYPTASIGKETGKKLMQACENIKKLFDPILIFGNMFVVGLI
jgi:hypothetical protein